MQVKIEAFVIPDFLSPKEAAAIMGVTKRSVQLYCKSGALHAIKVGNGYIISKDDLFTCNINHKVGRPRKEK